MEAAAAPSTERSPAEPLPRRGPRDALGSFSYPHAVALEDVVAVERRGVQGAGWRLVLGGAGEGG